MSGGGSVLKVHPVTVSSPCLIALNSHGRLQRGPSGFRHMSDLAGYHSVSLVLWVKTKHLGVAAAAAAAAAASTEVAGGLTETNSKRWFTTSFLQGGRCRKARLGVCD